jgi:TolB-like protein
VSSSNPPEKSIAVLPFENLSRDPDNAYFADGTQNEILTKLAGIGDLKVISRTSTAKYKSKPEELKTVAHELGVATVLEGSVQKAGDKVRVNVQLIDARSDTHLWAKSYDRNLEDILAVENDVAQEIADALQAKLSPSQANSLATVPTRNPEAYDLFLKGEYEERQAESNYKGETYDRAATFYRQALARDPNFVLAHARLAYSRLNRHWFVKRLTSWQLDEVKSDIERALAIAPDSPDAHLALGLFHYWGRHDFDSALREFDRAIELQPSNDLSRDYRAAIYRRRGEWRRALAEFERAFELGPRDVWKSDQLGGSYLALRRWPEAEHWLKHALALDPHHVGAAFRLNLTYIGSTGDIQRARQAWEGVPVQKATTTVGAYEIVIPEMIDERVYLDVLERRFPEALKKWDVAPADTTEARLVQLKARVGIQVLAGQSSAAQPECEKVRRLFEAELAKREPGDRTTCSELAWIYVCLGRNADALRLAREAAESMPMEKDAILGVNFLVGLAQIEAHTGQTEEAIKLLRQLLTMPAGEYISIARLKIDPVWDPIRNHPAFQKLLSEPEPETVYK